MKKNHNTNTNNNNNNNNNKQVAYNDNNIIRKAG